MKVIRISQIFALVPLWVSLQTLVLSNALAQTNIPFCSIILTLNVSFPAPGELEMQKADGTLVAYVNYEIHSNKLFLEYRNIVNESYKKIGLGTFMTAEILKRHPEITGMYAKLEQDNRAAFKRALNHGQSQLQALQNTPFYKIAKKLGFTKIDQKRSGLSTAKKPEIWIHVDK